MKLLRQGCAVLLCGMACQAVSAAPAGVTEKVGQMRVSTVPAPLPQAVPAGSGTVRSGAASTASSPSLALPARRGVGPDEVELAPVAPSLAAQGLPPALLAGSDDAAMKQDTRHAALTTAGAEAPKPGAPRTSASPRAARPGPTAQPRLRADPTPAVAQTGKRRAGPLASPAPHTGKAVGKGVGKSAGKGVSKDAGKASPQHPGAHRLRSARR